MDPEPQPPSSTWMVPIGILAGLLGAATAGVALLFALLTANSCGAFADSCDTYGQPSPEFLPAVGVAVLGSVAAVVGFVLVVVGMARNSKERRSPAPASGPVPGVGQ